MMLTYTGYLSVVTIFSTLLALFSLLLRLDGVVETESFLPVSSFSIILYKL